MRVEVFLLLMVGSATWLLASSEMFSKELEEDGELSLQKRQVSVDCFSPPTVKCTTSNEGQTTYKPECQDMVWICKSQYWTPFGLVPKTGASPKVSGSSCQEIKRVLTGQCFKPPASGAYYVQDMKVYCDMTTDGGGWTLVWKHSYVEITSVTQDMEFKSSFYKACVDLNAGPNGWCNIPKKVRFQPTEVMTVAYHKGTMVYAYKGYFNRNIDYHWTGGILLEPKKIVDHCTANNGVAPEPDYGHNSPCITFDKENPHKYTDNCDTIRIHGPPPYRLRSNFDCRWENCRPPSSISSSRNQHVQMTMAIFVR